jgi:hypothetical protein
MPPRPNEGDGVEAKVSKMPTDNCFVAFEGRGWTAWKVPNPDTVPNLEARVICQEGGPDHGSSYKFQWKTNDGTKAITWNYTSSALRQDPETYATRFRVPPGNATGPQPVDYSCGVTDSAELCVTVISWQENP